MKQQKKYPFKFLNAYTEEDTDIFFGRDDEIKALYEMVFQTDILLVYGASGTGKTSLINCGLASQFQDYDWLALNISRGKNINTALENALQKAGGDQVEEEAFDWRSETEEEDPSMTATPTMSGIQAQVNAVYLNYFRPIYLIFDQFEELFILGNTDEQATFIATVQQLLDVELPVKMIFIIREEYLGHLYKFERTVPQLTRKKIRIEPMNIDKVRQVIYGATELPETNVHLAPKEKEQLTARIFDIIKGKEKTLHIQLPYLQVFMDKLYLLITKDQSRQAEATISLSVLDEPAISSIDNVLRDFLDGQVRDIQATLVDAHPKIQEEDIWKMLSPLATLDGTKRPINRQDLHKDLPAFEPALINQLLDLLEKNRILRYVETENLYEISHDSLAQQIAAKRSTDEIALLEVRRLIKSQAALKADVQEFFSARQLDFIEPFLSQLNLEEEEQQLISKSQQARVEQEAAQKAQEQAELLAAQQQAEEQRQRAEVQAKLRKEAVAAQEQAEAERQKATRNLRMARIVTIVAVALAIMAGLFYADAQRAETTAVEAKEEAEYAKMQAENEKEASQMALDKNIRQQITNAAKAKIAFGDSYGKIDYACDSYYAALDTLKQYKEYKTIPLYQTLQKIIDEKCK